nr:M48 family metalloprotease [Rhodovibrio sodomensis]
MDGYLREVLNRVARAVTAADYTGEVGVFVTSQASFQAVTTPANEILVSSGALDGMASEEEVAFVVAHELSHVLRQDLERGEVMGGQDQTATQLFRIGQAASDLGIRALTVVEGDPEEARKILALRRQISIAVHALQLALENNVGPAWTRGQERIADKAAADMMHKAGYNPLNAAAVFGKLGEAQAQRSAEVDRHLKELTRLTGELVALRENDPMIARLKGAGVSLGGELLAGVTDAVRADPYDDAREREAAFKAYVAERYGLTEPGLGNVASLKRVKEGDTDYAAVRARVELAREAERTFEAALTSSASGEGQAPTMKDSVALALQAISGPGSEAGLPRLVFHRIRKETGDQRRARLNLEAIMAQSRLGPAPVIATAEYFAHTGDREKALELVDRLALRYGDTQVYPVAYDVTHALGDTVEAERILKACLSDVTTQYIRLQCRQRERAHTPEDEEPGFMEKLVGNGADSGDAAADGTDDTPAASEPQEPASGPGFFDGMRDLVN